MNVVDRMLDDMFEDDDEEEEADEVLQGIYESIGLDLKEQVIA